MSSEDIKYIRAAIISELEAINMYEEFAELVKDSKLREVFLEIAREEKTHVGELMAMLLKLDEEQAEEMEAGKAEVLEG